MNKLTLLMSILLLGNGTGVSGLSVFQPVAEGSPTTEVNTEAAKQADDVNQEIETSEGLEETTASSSEADPESEIVTTEENQIETSSTETFSDKEDDDPPKEKASTFADGLQDEDGYWLAGDLATLRTYIVTDKKKEIRLTADIDIAATALPLYDGFVLDGAGHTITYNKGILAAAGFYLQVTGATVTMKNINFGNPDGSGAVGYYGIITCYDANPNINMIFENINYITTNGQPLYNINGKIIFRGNNTFNQTGSGYSQEWAEANYIEVESGITNVYHNTTASYGFIYAHGTNSNSPYASSINVVVRSGAVFDVETSHAFFYSAAASYDQSIIVEDNGTLKVKQTSTNSVKSRFIYPNLGTSAATDFCFGKNANVQLDLKGSIPLYSSRGGMTVGEGAVYEMNVEEGQMFSLSTLGTFSMNIDNVKRAAFNGTADGTLGIRSSNTAISNLSFRGTNRIKVDAYSNASTELPSTTFNKVDTALYVSNTTYQNVSGDTLSAPELSAFATSKRLVFSSVWVPDVLSVSVSDESSQGATLSVNSENHGLPATKVIYYLFTEEKDIGVPEKAKYIYTLTDLSQQADGFYNYDADDLNPNTKYWMQAVVSNTNGQGDWSGPISFATDPGLKSLEIINDEDLTETTAKISGAFANNTGLWTDFSNGVDNPAGNQTADFGASFTDALIQLEYSRNSDFSNAESISVENRFGDNDSQFTEELTGLRPSATYYVRVRATAVSGREIVLPLVYEFETKYGEYIDVSIPVEMLFGTDNSEAATESAGTIYSKGASYEVVNQGNVDTAVQVTGFTPKNKAAENLKLLPDMNGQVASNQLALKLLMSGASSSEIFLTPELQISPVMIGIMNTTDENKLQLDFGGKFFNPVGEVLLPSYTMTLRFEKSE
ncbi:hypothetical protein IW492_10860 [Enterococcus sp. BWB1-3]|uniref:hypothetical protein n=1 Tax=Enterococcus sp. BWB1-3 TaxID=2787713 RepID=UPI0019241202|nr:hypothetical protein [Enterococcus sp. BWB1-3]MBL1229731.1 hypothetical protein [Enterococcus sp. BWB1-3]